MGLLKSDSSLDRKFYGDLLNGISCTPRQNFPYRSHSKVAKSSLFSGFIFRQVQYFLVASTP